MACRSGILVLAAVIGPGLDSVVPAVTNDLPATFRYLLKDGTFGVAEASFLYHGESKASTGPVALTTSKPESTVPASLEKDLARSRLTIIRDGERAVVALARPTSAADVNEEGGRFQPLLARELIRQAVLIAARDELGLATRDEVIGDVTPERTGPPAAEVASVFRPQPGSLDGLGRGSTPSDWRRARRSYASNELQS